MSQGRMRLATPCPLLMRPCGGCDDGGGLWVRLDMGQWKLLCTDIVVEQPWP